VARGCRACVLQWLHVASLGAAPHLAWQQQAPAGGDSAPSYLCAYEDVDFLDGFLRKTKAGRLALAAAVQDSGEGGDAVIAEDALFQAAAAHAAVAAKDTLFPLPFSTAAEGGADDQLSVDRVLLQVCPGGATSPSAGYCEVVRRVILKLPVPLPAVFTKEPSAAERPNVTRARTNARNKLAQLEDLLDLRLAAATADLLVDVSDSGAEMAVASDEGDAVETAGAAATMPAAMRILGELFHAAAAAPTSELPAAQAFQALAASTPRHSQQASVAEAAAVEEAEAAVATGATVPDISEEEQPQQQDDDATSAPTWGPQQDAWLAFAACEVGVPEGKKRVERWEEHYAQVFPALAPSSASAVEFYGARTLAKRLHDLAAAVRFVPQAEKKAKEVKKKEKEPPSEAQLEAQRAKQAKASATARAKLNTNVLKALQRLGRPRAVYAELLAAAHDNPARLAQLQSALLSWDDFALAACAAGNGSPAAVTGAGEGAGAQRDTALWMHPMQKTFWHAQRR